VSSRPESPSEQEQEQGSPDRAGFVAIVGRPNVGKSTLLNRLLGEKLAIVSHRPQTTRNRIVGIKTWQNQGATNQLVLVDTPGLHRRHKNLNQFMVRQALDSLDGADCVALMTEVAAPGRGKKPGAAIHPLDAFALRQVKARCGGTPVVVILNKIDCLDDRRRLLPMMAAWAALEHDCIVPISALKGEGCETLVDELVGRLPQGPPLYPEDLLTEQTERFLVGELIREQIYRLCH